MIAKQERLDSLSLELASEPELEMLATLGNPAQHRAARSVLLERARHLAHIAACELQACLARHPIHQLTDSLIH